MEGVHCKRTFPDGVEIRDPQILCYFTNYCTHLYYMKHVLDWKTNFKINLEEIRHNHLKRINLPQDKLQRWDAMNTVMKLKVL